MILTVDIGNTNIVIGCFEKKELLFLERLSTHRLRTAADYMVRIHQLLSIYQLTPEQIEGSILSSVVPPLTDTLSDAVHRLTGSAPLIVGPGIRTGLNILMDHPAQVGSDLIVAAVAGMLDYSLPVIIIDMGTATTFSAVDQKKNYLGTIILPGVRTSMDSLSSATSQLPRIALEAPGRVLGKNTTESMQSGAIFGNAACIDGMIDRIEEELGQSATIVATGGLAPAVTRYCRRDIITDDDLVLKGLLYLYDMNHAS
ncbi:MAG: type III pantothenate kinase [Eubacteriales bacterium]|nr:type III pantothenate kinase [Eubacteriales bacterium]